MIEQGWCDLIPKLLDFSDHDTREKVLSAMSTLKDHCKRNFYPALPTLHKLKIEYTKLAEEDEKSGEDDGYFSELLVSINHLLDQINSSSPGELELIFISAPPNNELFIYLFIYFLICFFIFYFFIFSSFKQQHACDKPKMK